jgi:hypothetical protein
MEQATHSRQPPGRPHAPNHHEEPMTHADSHPWIWRHLGRRLPTVKTAMDVLQSRHNIHILELGTTRSFREGRIETHEFNPDPDTWDWGAGCFTYTCLNLLPDAVVTSIDISQEALSVCQTLCSEHATRLRTKAIDSTTFLTRTQDQYDLIYMDHAEADRTDQTALLHLQDARIIVARSLLKPDGLILIDDVLLPKGQFSKGLYSVPFLTNSGFTELSHQTYQTLLRADT